MSLFYRFISLVAALVVSFASTVSFGNGSVVGNGGNLVTCPPHSRDPETIFDGSEAVLDLFDGASYSSFHYARLRELRGVNFREAVIRSAQQRLRHAPALLEFFLRQFDHFDRTTTYVPKFSRGSVFSPVASAKGCQVRRIAIQYSPRLATLQSPIELFISRDDWLGKESKSGIPADQKVALIFHEYLLRYLWVIGDPSCAYRIAPDIVAFVLSDESLGVSEDQWRERAWFTCDFQKFSFKERPINM